MKAPWAHRMGQWAGAPADGAEEGLEEAVVDTQLADGIGRGPPSRGSGGR